MYGARPVASLNCDSDVFGLPVESGVNSDFRTLDYSC